MDSETALEAEAPALARYSVDSVTALEAPAPDTGPECVTPDPGGTVVFSLPTMTPVNKEKRKGLATKGKTNSKEAVKGGKASE